ncbi:hypothetical protein E3P92_00509 [Wallemia ichthyophaga]|nr:hypothetical protein E3P94_00715 [Wallemia ichthyophaga]TIB18667.1 hypothetical protein E3P92_00509 [Wallemia ichthyophaga]
MKTVYINCDNVNLNPISVTQESNNLELLDALYDTLDSTDVADSERQLNIPSHPRREPSLSEHRTNYEVTAKLFVTDPDYSKWNKKTLNDAFECLHRTTSLGSVDSLIFSFNGLCDDTSDSSDRLDAAARIWKSLTPEFPHTQLGVADFGPIELDKLIAKIKDTARQPQTTQISLSDCCEPPSELVKTAKQHDVELTAHPDIHDILSPAELAAAFNRNQSHQLDEKSVGIDWVLKYTVVAHGRAVVADKGYIIRASLS